MQRAVLIKRMKMNLKCELRQDKKNRIKCINCKKVYGKVGEVDISKLSTSCSRPSILQMSKNLATSTIKHLANGAAAASSDQQKLRSSICESCDFFDADSKRCNSCGCFVNIKVTWASESCPEGKWASEKLSKTSGGCGGCGRKKT
jgi:hypothetical protein